MALLGHIGAAGEIARACKAGDEFPDEAHAGQDAALGAEQALPPAARASGDLQALVLRYQGAVWRYLRLLGADLHEADDLMQEAFVRCAERLRAGDCIVAPMPFLRGVARNLLLGARRRQRRRPPQVPWLDAVDEFVALQPAAIEDGRVDALRQCLQRLQGRSQQAVVWHHTDGLSHEQVAVRLGIGMHGVKSLLSRARDVLRDCVERRIQEEQRS